MTFAIKIDLTNLKSDVNELDIDKLKTSTNVKNLKSKVDKLDVDKLKVVPIDLKRPSGIVKNEALEKLLYNILVSTFTDIDTDIDS